VSHRVSVPSSLLSSFRALQSQAGPSLTKGWLPIRRPSPTTGTSGAIKEIATLTSLYIRMTIVSPEGNTNASGSSASGSAASVSGAAPSSRSA